MQISKQEFEKIIEQTLEGLPEKFKKKLNNIAVFAEDEPDSEQLKKANLKIKVVDADYRTAASNAGMYDITEEQFVKITTKGKRGR